MAVSPGTYNIIMQRRADYSVQLVFKDSNNNAINLTGYTVYAQCWDEGRNIKYGDFAVTYTDRAAGTIDIALTDAQTATFLANKLSYDVLLENPSGLREYYLEGVITMSEGYTSP
mgnify:FL=1|tara:strand:- start:553 stop:897 length:345 start_codon:yes stop_codon:yes gene_type:complete